LIEAVTRSRTGVALAAALVGASSLLAADPTEQRIAAVPAVQDVAPGGIATVTVGYDAADSTLAGLALRLHYDSTKLGLEAARLLYSHGVMGHQDQPDAGSDYADQHDDGDPGTDRRYLAAWSVLDARWPGEDVALPLPLLELRFRVNGSFATADLRLTGAGCGVCSLVADSALIRLTTGAGEIVEPTPSAPTATATPTPGPPEVFGPQPGDQPVPHGLPIQGIPALSDLGAVLFGAMLAAVAVVLLIRRRS
jgi:hypothetical protein